jgi:hypothetical protein
MYVLLWTAIVTIHYHKKVAAFAPLEAQLLSLREAGEDRSEVQAILSEDVLAAKAQLEDADRRLLAVTADLQLQTEENDVRLGHIKQDMKRLDTRIDTVGDALAATDKQIAPLKQEIESSRADAMDAISAVFEKACEHSVQTAAATEQRCRKALHDAATDLADSTAALADRCARTDAVTEAFKVAAEERVQALELRAGASEAAAAAALRAAAVDAQRLRESMEQTAAQRELLDAKVAADAVEEALQRRTADAAHTAAIALCSDQLAVLTAALDAAKRSASSGTDLLKAEVHEALCALLPVPPKAAVTGSGVTGLAVNSGTSSSKVPATSMLVTCKTLRAHSNASAEALDALQRSGISNAITVRRLEHVVQNMATKGPFWENTDIKLAAHCEEVGRVCLGVEDCTVQREKERENLKRGGVSLSLTAEAQRLLAGNTQRIAKLLATKADYETLHLITRSENPASEAYDWDDKVLDLRNKYLEQFMVDAAALLNKRAPHQGPIPEAARSKFMKRLESALKVAVSKHKPTTPGTTLFGKVRMQPQACVACDRPFAAAGNTGASSSDTNKPGSSSSGGNRAAAKPTGVNGFPSETAYKSRGTFRPHTSQGRLGSPSKRGNDDVYSDVFSTDGCQPLSGVSQSGTNAGVYAVPVFGEKQNVYEGDEDNGKLHQLEHSQSQQKFVYRGGFKLPKYVRSSVSLADGLGSVTASVTETGSYTGNSKSGNGFGNGFGNGSKQRPHTSSGGSSTSRQQQQYGVAVSSTFEPAFPSLYADDDASSVLSGVTTMQHQQQQIRNQ